MPYEQVFEMHIKSRYLFICS